MIEESREVPGLEVKVNRVVYFDGGDKLPADRPHAFVYFITIHNNSTEELTLLGRKWVVLDSDGRREVVEGDGIVGKNPLLGPGEHFSYNSFHTTRGSARAEGSFHGIDAHGFPVHVRIPSFEMTVPRVRAE